MVLADDAVPLEVGELKPAKIAQEDRRAVSLRDHDGAEVVKVLDKADGADDEAEIAPRHHAAAGVAAVGVDGGFDVCQRQIETHELLRIELKLELRRDTAEIRPVGNP